jgi:predicted HTH transcriptional regulator
MKHKPVETPDEMLEHLREYVNAEIGDNKEGLMNALHDTDEYDRGVYKGYDMAMNEIDQHIRHLYKHGYEHLRVDDYEEVVTEVKDD